MSSMTTTGTSYSSLSLTSFYFSSFGCCFSGERYLGTLGISWTWEVCWYTLSLTSRSLLKPSNLLLLPFLPCFGLPLVEGLFFDLWTSLGLWRVFSSNLSLLVIDSLVIVTCFCFDNTSSFVFILLPVPWRLDDWIRFWGNPLDGSLLRWALDYLERVLECLADYNLDLFVLFSEFVSIVPLFWSARTRTWLPTVP